MLVPLALAPTALAAVLTGHAGTAVAAPAPAAAPGVELFPSDRFTVPDATQLTGRRVALPTDDCGSVPSCGLTVRINRLDGFDLDPRLALRFGRAVGPRDVADVVASTSLVRADGSGGRIAVDRVVLADAGDTVYAHPRRQLEPGTTYRLSVSAARGLPAASTTFTTLSAPDGLLDLRRQLDSGRAFTDAGIPADRRGLRVDAVVPVDGTTFSYDADQGSEGGIVPTPVPALLPGATVVLGSYLAPTWLRADRTIEQVGTRSAGPTASDERRLPFVLVLPAGPAPAGGWPTAVFGHGFTRSSADVLLAATTNAASGLATIGTTVVGHGYGSRSAWSWTRDGVTRTVPAYGRGFDQDQDGTIGSTEGSSAPGDERSAGVGSRDALRQTAADVMTLVRAVERGLDVAGTPAGELRPREVTYFGQSFGGIYGTMVAGADPRVARAVLNVPGGPVVDIARLSPAFRPLITQSLATAGLLNSTSQDKGLFDESLPLQGDEPVLDPAPGALPIQDFLARTAWLTRPGSPETFAPLVRDDRALFQVAFGDETVPNPTSHTLLEAGELFPRTSVYRNDRTAVREENPHGFLLNPLVFPAAFAQGQAQVRAFLGDGTVLDPDGPGDVWQVPFPRPALLQELNYTSPAFPQG